jgi:hypothetical protein
MLILCTVVLALLDLLLLGSTLNLLLSRVIIPAEFDSFGCAVLQDKNVKKKFDDDRDNHPKKCSHNS